jgi:O-antigen/teichoic acid export membrane protein
VPAIFGEQYDDAGQAFVPALASVVFAPVNALALQASALRLRPRTTLAAAVASAIVFAVVALVTISDHGATGGTSAMLAAASTSAVVSLVLLHDAIGRRVATASFAGAAIVLTLGLVS